VTVVIRHCMHRGAYIQWQSLGMLIKNLITMIMQRAREHGCVRFLIMAVFVFYMLLVIIFDNACQGRHRLRAPWGVHNTLLHITELSFFYIC